MGTESITFTKLFRLENWNLGAAPALHLPIFTAGRIRAQLYEKLAKFNQAVYSYNELILKAAQEIADSLSKLQALFQEMAIREESVGVATEQKSLIHQRFRGALATRSDSLSAEDTVLQRELQLATVQFAAQLAEIDLIRELGGGFHE